MRPTSHDVFCVPTLILVARPPAVSRLSWFETKVGCQACTVPRWAKSVCLCCGAAVHRSEQRQHHGKLALDSRSLLECHVVTPWLASLSWGRSGVIIMLEHVDFCL